MNSQLVVGVGNIYASEALFRARIAPRRAAGRITRAEAAKLARAIKAVLSAAIKIGGTTLRDYRNVDGAPGYFRQKLFVYERAGARCRVCKSPIKQFTQGQRSTYWCADLPALNGGGLVASRPILRPRRADLKLLRLCRWRSPR